MGKYTSYSVTADDKTWMLKRESQQPTIVHGKKLIRIGSLTVGGVNTYLDPVMISHCLNKTHSKQKYKANVSPDHSFPLEKEERREAFNPHILNTTHTSRLHESVSTEEL